MTRAQTAFLVILAAALGLWGCSQAAVSPTAASVVKIRSLESKVTKQQEDYRSVQASRDEVRKKLASVEEERTRLQQEIAQLKKQYEQNQTAFAKDRQELKLQVAQRTQERDNLQGQFNEFRTGVKALLSQTETSTSLSPITKF